MGKKKENWFSDGLRFSCRRCGCCCTGEPGYVYVGKGEVSGMAKFLGVDDAEFVRRFTRSVKDRTSLTEEEDGGCVFWRDDGCSVYPVRPRQCRTFPFWLLNVARPDLWERTAVECPGINSGKLFTEGEIVEIMESMMSAAGRRSRR